MVTLTLDPRTLLALLLEAEADARSPDLHLALAADPKPGTDGAEPGESDASDDRPSLLLTLEPLR